MKLQARFCLLGLVFVLFYCSPCKPRKHTGYEFPVFSTESCPRNNAEWNERSSIINCTQSNGYTCLPNENFTELLEFCYVYPRILITKGICLYLYKRYSRVNSYNCSHFRYGCPDSNYFTSEVYNYPTCISIKDGCFLAEPSCESTTITYPEETNREWRDNSTIVYLEETTKHIHIQNDLSNDIFIEISLGTVISILVVPFSIILYSCRRRRNFSKGKNETDIENNNDELNSLIENPKLYKVDTTKEVSPCENAVKVFEEQIRCFRKEDRRKYCALVLLALFNNKFCSDDVVRNKLLSYKFERALTMCGLPQDTPLYDISDNLDLLKGVFVKKIGDAYEFYFNLFMEVTSFILGKDYPAELTQYADIRFLLRGVTLYNGSEQNRPFTIYLSDRNIDILGERFFKVFFEECYIEVILHPALRDKRLMNELLQKFERHPKKLQELLQTKKSMYDDHKQYWPITDDTMSKLAFVALENEFSPLCALVAFCHSELSVYCIKTLYQSKPDSIGKYLISAVCCNGSKDFLEMFSDEFIKDSLTETFGGLFPIHITALFYNFDILQELIYLGADVNMKTKNEKSWTPLMFAASRYDTDPQNNKYNMDTSTRRDQTVQMLINYEADVNLCAGDGVSSLYLACQNGYTSMVEILLSNGANINQCTKNGESPLFITCQHGHYATVQLLLERGADINSRTTEDEYSPLCTACVNGYDSIVQNLLDHNADVNLCTITGASPLFIASLKGFNSSVQLLLDKGAAVNICKKNGASPLYIACQNDHISTVKLLLNNGADVNLCRKDKTSPLFIACQNGNENLVQLLLDSEADINICDEDGAGPLFIACQKGYHEIVQLLLTNMCDNAQPWCQAHYWKKKKKKNSANIDSCTLEGFSPLVIACQNGHEETVRTLVKNGASINIRTKKGTSPENIALQNGHKSIAQLLKEYELQFSCSNFFCIKFN